MAGLARLLAPLLLLAFTSAGAQVSASTYPERPIRFIVPFPPGGPTDVLARVVGTHLSKRLGQTVIVDNRPGGNTIIGATAAARAPADGYTLLVTVDSTLAMNPWLYKDLAYDPQRDFAPVARLASVPLILAAKAGGPQDPAALVQSMKRADKPLSYGHGTLTSQLSGELMKKGLGLPMLAVPYKGSAPVTQALLTGEVDFILTGVTAVLPHIQSGKVVATARMGKLPVPSLPATRALAELPGLKDFDVSVWMGVVAPAGTPAAIVQRLGAEMAAVMSQPEVQAGLQSSGLVADYAPPDEFKTFIASELKQWRSIIESAGIPRE